jgi:lipopolysaccharide heptosyltransferase II
MDGVIAPKKILIRGPNWVGDAVLAIPALKAVRSNFPNAEITLLVRPWVAGLFTSAPFIDRVWTEDKPTKLGDWTRITRDIRAFEFDVALLLPNSFESALMIFLARIPKRIGYATDGRTWMLTDSIEPSSESQHQVHYYLDLAKAIRAETDKPSIEIEATEEERENARNLLAEQGIAREDRFLVLNPGAAYGSAKRWHEDRFADVADILSSEMNLAVAMIGSQAERPIAEQIQARMKRPSAILSGKTSLEALIGVLAESSLMVTNDSGPMHIAAALGVPTVAVFGSTDERVTSPFGPRTRVVKNPVECSPCLLRECPIDHRCMNGVSVEDVCKAARDILSN